ncbi:MAG: hypothetical protein ACYSTI_12725 [Planctomycetota bacterium]|jgi:hypothetical protein
MKIWGVSKTGLEFALALGNAKYAGNIRFKDLTLKNKREYIVRLCHFEPGPGSKIFYVVSRVDAGFSSDSTSEVRRTGPAVCWHAHRDFMRAVFEINPEAKIKTSFTAYNNAEHFEENYRDSKFGKCLCEDEE